MYDTKDPKCKLQMPNSTKDLDLVEQALVTRTFMAVGNPLVEDSPGGRKASLEKALDQELGGHFDKSSSSSFLECCFHRMDRPIE
jgi:hypothetical protein